ncbi:uncharacterized protein tp53i13 [Genypterus blacodes]|uniref:uncharacterized protein tp53i13 n=1 Tax=Genypterus blacodes TaxID=154954 RepID=UPI003F762576
MCLVSLLSGWVVVAMPSDTTSRPAAVTVLAALWVTLGRCGGAATPWRGCDNGKLFLERDLPSDPLYLHCPGSSWPESTQRLPTIDTVYDPEPASEFCLDQSITYNHSIPNSGAYRPVRAESGDYMYCPPQRWLNNLHHGAVVLLYHPCAPLRERLLLSTLARLCLQNYIITPHSGLSQNRPIALVSWGRTLQLSTVASSGVCDWLEPTATTGFTSSDGIKYNLLLTKPAVQQSNHAPLKTKESLRGCCEQTLSSLLSGAMEAEREKSKYRRRRAAIIEKQLENENKRERNTSHDSAVLPVNQTNKTILNDTGEVQMNDRVSGPLSETPRTLAASYQADAREAASHPLSDIHSPNQSSTPSPAASLMSNKSESTHGPDSLGSRASGAKSDADSQKHMRAQTEPLQPRTEHTDEYANRSGGNGFTTDGVNSERTLTARPEAEPGHMEPTHLTLSVKQQRTDMEKQGATDRIQRQEKYSGKEGINGKRRDNEVVDVKEREVAHKQAHSHTHTQHKNEQTGFNSAPKTQSQSEPPTQTQQHQSDIQDCGDCSEGSEAVLSSGLPRTPRTDEAVWAAAALGFLLTLLTLSVLHTRLYRHWRTTPSLYWRDPQQDYDSVADVIHRRLRIAKNRRKRGRRQECVLLPSSSSSDEQ